ncbi:MAG: hypothetical protein QOF83_4258, partial [Solirubrobacteraceae bacterium]|nr:hypothetical protein [Solirubrobacteraceae bacterium]
MSSVATGRIHQADTVDPATIAVTLIAMTTPAAT